jgi:hypothetical protein
MTRAAQAGTPYKTNFIADDDPPKPVTLPRVRWLERPIPVAGPREVLGAKAGKDAPSTAEYLRNLAAMHAGTPPDTPPSLVQAVQRKGGGAPLTPAEPRSQPDQALVPTETELDDGAVILEGELAAARLKKSIAMADWIAVGRALLVLRRQATQEAGAYKGRKYSQANSALLYKHGFQWITKSSRQCAMLVTENLAAVEAWLATLPEEKRLGLNHPVVIWGHYQTAQRIKDGRRQRTTWRNREPIDVTRYLGVYEAIRPLLADQHNDDIIRVCRAAIRAMGFSVPVAVFRPCKKAHEHRARA